MFIDEQAITREILFACSKIFIAILRSLINIKKSKGPRTEPWGTPYFTVF